jgi:glycosyltransferase involved in cell wall biosynthesis
MIGRTFGQVTTQGEKLSDLFSADAYAVISVSNSPNRYIRFVDIVNSLFRYRTSIDIMMLQVFSGPSFVVEDVASWLGKRFGHRIIMTLRGGAMPEFMSRFPNWTKRVLSRADAIIAPSRYLAEAIVPYGLEAEVIPNVINLPAYPFRHRDALEPQLFWMRSFHEIYNPRMALRVLKRVRSVIPEARLTMAGSDKGIEDDVRQMANQSGLNGAVRFCGFLGMEQKFSEGDAADLYINTNRIDNMPVGVVEACAMGLPVVATNVGGIPYLLKDGETALLVPDDDDEAMAAAVIRLLQDHNLAGRLSTNGRLLAEGCSWEVVRPKWEALFRRVMN